MQSFKLDKGGSGKSDITSGGALLLVLGIVVYILFHPLGWVLSLIGLALLLAGLFASDNTR